MKLFLAPIQGMTIALYRNLYAEYFGGIDTYYSPFIDTNNMRKSNSSLFKDILPQVNTKGLDVVPQLLSNNADNFKFFANTISAMGYKEINWNIGCPYPMVTKKKKGSGILAHPDMIREFLDEVCKDLTYDLTVKMRLGMDDLEEGIKVIEVLNDYPLCGVMIHGRTGRQMYTGTVDLDAFEVLYKSCQHEMTYNGDIFTVDDYNKINSRFPDIDNFMLGRGALIDPFLASDIKGGTLTTSQKFSIMKDFHDAVYSHYKSIISGDKHLCDRMKEFWMYTSVHLDPTGKFLKKIKKCTTIHAYLEVINQLFHPSNGWME
ncbi:MULTISPECIES: tRNA-dihydrouridine synthase [unclassified Fusibacter]|uniref:tRNA dihydrouridine synthase n=1 Tax=unclassified Fusibacter TaxID=2624464 RepID=UPI00101066DB|nr:MULTISPECIES: tRNA-dihydrouridine synthase family protein [unclassified Fusibacter]MCK8059144.1 tRNA-dihydrouridine synthase family protein [Fusibacter sp. A2]NPE22553.1 tRNA-dihydrouridine synthase family protein [Fusibacter sp. A1]RXV60655.1 tRNA-dihydrouridine synthase family protein [Fusibacter sp. A1]